MPGAGVGDSNHFPTCRLDRLEHCFDADWHCTSSQHREAAGSSSQAGRMTEPSGLAASGYGNQAVTKPPHQPCHRLAARRGDNHAVRFARWLAGERRAARRPVGERERGRGRGRRETAGTAAAPASASSAGIVSPHRARCA
eukprot:scaffold29973_cov61-Phaeocystis_antarctica.AAC.6